MTKIITSGGPRGLLTLDFPGLPIYVNLPVQPDPIVEINRHPLTMKTTVEDLNLIVARYQRSERVVDDKVVYDYLPTTEQRLAEAAKFRARVLLTQAREQYEEAIQALAEADRKAGM